MLVQKFGLNVHGLNFSNGQRLMDFVINKRPQAMLSMNNPNLAEQFVRADVPHSIYRHRFARDEEIHFLSRDGYEWWGETRQQIKAVNGGKDLDRRVIVNVGNELHGDPSRINRFLNQAAEAMAQDGYRGVFGNFAAGTLEPQMYRNELAPFIYNMSTKYRDIHFIGVHEYMMMHPFLGVSGYGWNGLTPVDNTPMIPLSRRTKYIIGRYEDILKVSPAGSLPQILVTEFGTDHVVALAQQFGFPQSMRGYKTQFATQQHMLKIYKLTFQLFYTNPIIKGVTAFSYGDSGGWETFNLEDAAWFLENVDALKVESPDKTKMELVEVKATGVVNIRSGPSTSYADIGDVPNEWTVVTVLNTAKEGNYTWKQYRFSDSFAGWVRSDVVQERSYVPADAPVYISIPGFEVNISEYTQEQRSDMAKVIRGVSEALKQFAQEIEA